MVVSLPTMPPESCSIVEVGVTNSSSITVEVIILNLAHHSWIVWGWGTSYLEQVCSGTPNRRRSPKAINFFLGPIYESPAFLGDGPIYESRRQGDEATSFSKNWKSPTHFATKGSTRATPRSDWAAPSLTESPFVRRSIMRQITSKQLVYWMLVLKSMYVAALLWTWTLLRLNGDATLCGTCLHDTWDDTWSHGGISNTTNAKANALTIIWYYHHEHHRWALSGWHSGACYFKCLGR